MYKVVDNTYHVVRTFTTERDARHFCDDRNRLDWNIIKTTHYGNHY